MSSPFLLKDDARRFKSLKTSNFSISQIFVGNDDSKTIAVRHLRHPITARYVRIHPQAWYGVHICMRAELYGCDHLGRFVLLYEDFSSRPLATFVGVVHDREKMHFSDRKLIF